MEDELVELMNKRELYQEQLRQAQEDLHRAEKEIAVYLFQNRLEGFLKPDWTRLNEFKRSQVR